MKLKRLDYVMPGIYLIILLIVLGSFLVSTPWKKSGNMDVSASISTCTTTTTTTTVTTTTVTTCTTTVTTTTTTVTTVYDFKDRLVDYGMFRGTYYRGEGINPCPGGSGRMLLDCTPKSSDEIKGSVACRRIQEDYGYNINGRTRVYLAFPSYPQMDGWYYVDDACASYNVIDVYFIDYNNCPWQNDGVTDIHLWLEPS